MKETIFERYSYVFLIVIALTILLQFFSQNSLTDETGAVVLNLHELNSSHLVENAGDVGVNVTVYERNEITGSLILEPQQFREVEGENPKVIGEQYE